MEEEEVTTEEEERRDPEKHNSSIYQMSFQSILCFSEDILKKKNKAVYTAASVANVGQGH